MNSKFLKELEYLGYKIWETAYREGRKASIIESNAEKTIPKEIKQLCEWSFSLLGYFNQYSFFTKKLWKKIEGFEKEDEVNIKCLFMHYWLHNKFGYFTCPVGTSWFVEVNPASYNNYIEMYSNVISTFEEWQKDQR